jgi:hypothetical protein
MQTMTSYQVFMHSFPFRILRAASDLQTFAPSHWFSHVPWCHCFVGCTYGMSVAGKRSSRIFPRKSKCFEILQSFVFGPIRIQDLDVKV